MFPTSEFITPRMEVLSPDVSIYRSAWLPLVLVLVVILGAYLGLVFCVWLAAIGASVLASRTRRPPHASLAAVFLFFDNPRLGLSWHL